MPLESGDVKSSSRHLNRFTDTLMKNVRMIRRRFLEVLDLCGVPVMALAIAIAAAQSGGQGRGGFLDRTADAVAARELMLRSTGLPYGEAPFASTMSEDQNAQNGLNPRHAPAPTVPEFHFYTLFQVR
jgi:hypothetical protein